MLVRVLLIVDDPDMERRLDRIFEPLQAAVATAPQEAVLWDRVKAFPADLVVIHRSSLLTPIVESVGAIQALPERPEVIVVGDEENPEERARLLIAGCTAVLNMALDDGTLRDVFDTFVTRQRQTSIERLQQQIDSKQPRLSDFASASATVRSFLRIVERVVQPDSSLLIQGETGVGKERLARAIHAASPRAAGPFIPVIVSAFPEALVEGELFGSEKGAYTGAVAARRGCFELAHGGTIFLDEIGELSPHVQVKLLRVVQDRVIQPLGGERAVHVDVRVMSATNRRLLDEIEVGTFRRDLFYRLSVVTLDMPPLREHPEDIANLAERYLAEFRVRLGSGVASFSDEAMHALTRYSWPGNIRELINVIERAVLLCDGRQITVADLPRTIAHDAGVHDGARSAPGLDALFDGLFDGLSDGDWRDRPWRDVRDAVVGACERTYIVEQLTSARGSVEETARRSGINPRSLYSLMKRHGLNKEDYRRSE